MADKIVSWGGFDSKGTSGMGVTGSLSVIGSGSFGYSSIANGNTYIKIDPNQYNSRITFNDFDDGIATRGGELEMSTYYSRLTYGSYNWFYIGNTSYPYLFYIGDNRRILISEASSKPTNATAMLQVKGTGTTSSTTALLVQNANASASLSVLDDGSVGIGTASPFSSGLTVANPAYTGYGRVYMNANNTFIVADNGTGGNITFGPTNRIFINSPQVSLPSGYINIGNSAIISTSGSYQGTTFSLGNFIANNIGGSTGLTIASRYTSQGAGGPNTGTVVRIIDTGIDTIAGITNTLTMLAINPSVNTTGGTTTLRGIYYNPTISSSVGLIQHTAIETTAGSVLFNGGNVGIGTSFPSSSLHISGASAVLTLTPQDPLPSGVPTGSFAVSSSAPPKPYFYDGTAWNALY